jgi:hypothetical protein|tara:strand:- start:2668 stop:3057 length:390 start_codon:yes stop_codon:yes gene_type:complete
MNSNIFYNIKENLSKDKKNELFNNEIIHNEIISIVENKLERNYNNFDFDSIISLQLYYDDNYTKKDLEMIADYYSITKRKKRKAELIQDIVLFEINPENEEFTQKRKLMWFYLSELESDSYLRKFLIFK